MMINLSNQVVCISGGSRGIGAATARLFARSGASVAILFSQNKREAGHVIDSVEEYGRDAEAFRCRVEQLDDCQKAIRSVLRHFGKIDILVNSAGIWEFGKIGELSERNWKKTLDVNLTGTFNLCNEVVPIMKRRKYGRIINISSTAGQRGEPFHSHYAASKGGIIAFTKSIAAELIRDGIRVNCVAPGWVDTDMVAGALRNRRARKEIEQSIPRNKIATPEDIAGPILFLASDLSDHIVGEVINVNGGSVLCG
ncbi:MAG TPA: SDR family NAD(P)-dependent oxidoreductase [Bacteroidota bacterium]|nr:SDR family NAD(P)-dependent oxidoreductase [Bacteroidota bacterium]